MQYDFSDLLFDVDSKPFAPSKSVSHCFHHMFPLCRLSSRIILRPTGTESPKPNFVFAVGWLIKNFGGIAG